MPADTDDPVLGHIRWDANLDWWTGSVEVVPGHPVDVQVSYVPDDRRPEETPEAVLATAGRTLAHVRQREPDYRRWSAERLNGTRWNTDEPMTVDEIVALLRVASVLFFADGSAQIYWNDDDRLFWGNNLLTEVGPDGQCVAARME
jgi:hypothetical protein